MKKLIILTAILIFSFGLCLGTALADPWETRTFIVDCSKNVPDFEELLEKVAHARIVEVILKGDCGLDEPIIWTIERDDVWVSGREDDEDPCPDPLPTINGMIVLQYANRVTLDCLKVTGPNHGVVAYGSNFWIYNSEISGNDGLGLFFDNNSSATVHDSYIYENDPHGVLIRGHSFVTVINSDVRNNGSLPDRPDAEIQLSRDAGLVLGFGTSVDGGDNLSLECLDSESRFACDGCTVTFPLACSTF